MLFDFINDVLMYLSICFSVAIAAAAGSSVYLYKNLKPFYKYSLPSLEVLQTERDLWAAFYKAYFCLNYFFTFLCIHSSNILYNSSILYE